MRSTSYWEVPPEPETLHFERVLDVHRVSEVDAIKALVPSGRVAFIGEARAHADKWGIKAERVNPPTLVGPLDRLRALKTPYEVLCLAEANRRAAAGHAAALEAF
jgi:Xaa-Pro dipeptidase